jgi:DNA primase
VLYPSTNSFYCFGCCEGGDVIELVSQCRKATGETR